jgi:hypothetical protein
VDDQDCNDNGDDRTSSCRLTRSSEATGEIASSRTRIESASPVYRGRLPVYRLYDSPGSIFVQILGSTPTRRVTGTYEDRNDGTGARCANALSPAQQGFLVARDHGHRSRGGRDGLPGARTSRSRRDLPATTTLRRRRRERSRITVKLRNKSGLDLDDVVVGLTIHGSEDRVHRVPVVSAGSVLSGADFTTPPFRVKVAAGAPSCNARRWTSSARTFRLRVRSNKFESLTRDTEFFLELT